MGAAETVAAILGSSAVSSVVTAWAMLRGKQVDTLHLSEIEFRKALLLRIEQLERGATEDTRRIAELEAEVRNLRRENEELRRGQP